MEHEIEDDKSNKEKEEESLDDDYSMSSGELCNMEIQMLQEWIDCLGW